MKKHIYSKISLSIALFAMLSTAYAQPQSDKGKPPQQAFDVCLNATAGQQCEFTGKRGSVSGICFSPAENLPLACKPERSSGEKKQPRR